MFKYIDEDGNAKYFYSWKLDKNDPTPKGKQVNCHYGKRKSSWSKICLRALCQVTSL
jgi:hypothetical protein